MKIRGVSYVLMAIFGTLTGLYPAAYGFFAASGVHASGVLHDKSAALLASRLYLGAFYLHIAFGGIALLIGWLQFSERLRTRNLRLHRLVGKTYLTAVFFSSSAGFGIALFANGGPVCMTGFGLLAICWFYTAMQGYRSVLRLDIERHRRWMIRNYALTFAAVTLRMYLPLATFAMHLPFIPAYRVISWLCWVPNLIFAELLIRRRASIAVAPAGIRR